MRTTITLLCIAAVIATSCHAHDQLEVTLQLIHDKNYAVRMPCSLAMLSNQFKVLIDEHAAAETNEPLVIPVLNTDRATISRLFDEQGGYLKQMLDQLQDKVNAASIRTNISDAILYEQLSDDDLIRLLLVANYLEIPILLEAAAAVMGTRASNFWEIGEEDNDGRIQKTLRVKENSSGNVIAPELKALIASTLPVIRPPRIFNGHTSEVHSVAFAPDGNSIASGSYDKTVRIWDIRTDQPARFLKGHTNRVRSVAFAPNSDSIASGSDDRTVRIWNIRTDQLAHTLNEHTNWVISVAFAPDGNSIASGSFDRTVRIWDIRTDQPARILNGYTNRVRSVAFAPDGHSIASGSFDRTVRIWDIRTDQPAHTLNGHSGWVNSVAFAPDSNLVASGSDDKTVRIWDIRTDQPARILEGHTDWIHSVAFSPDGNLVASGSNDKTVRIWDIRTDQPARILEGHSNCVRSVAFAPDSNSIASGPYDNTVRLWPLKESYPALLFGPEQEVDDIIIHHLEENSLRHQPQLLIESSCSTSKAHKRRMPSTSNKIARQKFF